MLKPVRTGALVGLFSFVVACGSSLPATPTSEVPAAGSAATAPTSAPDSGNKPAATATAAPAPAPKKVSNVSISVSQMAAKVSAEVGIDMKKPPAMATLSLSQKKKLMPYFQKALGYDSCEGCHAEGDFKKKTEHVQIASKMWDNFVVEMRGEKGEPLFCDSCHNGNSHLFDRSDKDAVQKFMSAEYTKKLTRADGNDQNCQSCHGDLFEMKIFKNLWQVKK